MPGTTRISLEGVARRLSTVFGPWSRVEETNEWDLHRERISLVRVYGISGAISVRGVTGDRASLHVRKVIHIPQVGAAEAFASRIRVRHSLRNEKLYVRVLHPRPPIGGRVFVHLELRVPHAVDVDLRASRGPISVRSVEGAVQGYTRAGNITVRDCLGPMTLESGDGIIDVADSEGGVVVRCGRGAVRLDAISGRVRVRSHDAHVTATGVRGALDARLRRGSLSLTGGSGRVRLQTGHGDVRAALGIGHRDVAVTSHRGQVALSLGAVEGEIRVEVRQGGVQLALDPAFSGRLEALTHAGQVRAGILGTDVGMPVDRIDVQMGGSKAAHVRMVSMEGDITVTHTRRDTDTQLDEDEEGEA